MRFFFKRRPKPVKRGLPWAPRFGNRCKARLKRGEDPEFFGRCELQADHYSDMPDEHHALERGMVNVRWDDNKLIRYEQS